MRYEQFVQYYDRIFPFNNVQADFFTEYISVNTSILELGCGTGKLAERLASESKNIIGIDNDETMIVRARKVYPEIEFKAMAVQDIGGLHRSFDLIICTGNVLSYLNDDEMSNLVSNVERMLNSGGYWIFQVINWDSFKGMENYQFPDKNIDGMVFSRSYDFNKNGIAEFTLGLSGTEGGDFSEVHTLYMRDNSRFIKLHENSGLKIENCYLNWQKQPWSATSNGGIIQVYKKGLK